MQTKIKYILDHTLQDIHESIALTKTQLFDELHDGIYKIIAGKQVSKSMIDTNVHLLTEQSRTMATDLSFLSYASDSPKPISIKIISVTTDFTCLSYSLIPPNSYPQPFSLNLIPKTINTILEKFNGSKLAGLFLKILNAGEKFEQIYSMLLVNENNFVGSTTCIAFDY